MFEDMDRKRAGAQAAAKNQQNGWLSRHKHGAMAGLIGLIMAGSMSFFMLPAVVIGQFGQVANFLTQTTQTVHDLAVGARSMRNMVVSAKYAAKAAVAGAVKDRFQMSRVGVFGSMVGQNYLKQLSEAGFTVKTDALGRFDGIDLNINKLLGTNNTRLIDASHFPEGSPGWDRAMMQNMRTEERIQNALKAKYPSLADQFVVSPDGQTLSTKSSFKPNYRQALDLMDTAGDLAGAGKTGLGRAIKTRYTARMLGIYSKLHPIENLKGQALDKIKEWYRARKAQDSGKANNSAPRESAKDADGKPTNTGEPELKGLEGQGGGEKAPKIGKGAMFKSGLKGGLAAILLIGLCAINSAKDNYLENMQSLTTTISGQYQEFVSQWAQIQSSFSGLDDGAISMDTLGVLSQDFYQDNIPSANYEIDDNGNVVTNADTVYTSQSWTTSSVYQAKVNGVAISTDRVPMQVQTMYQDNGGWGAQVGTFLDEIPVLGTIIGVTGDVLCSEVAGWIMDILGSLNPIGLVTTAIMHIPAVSDKVGELIAWAFQIGSGTILDLDNLDPDQLMDVAWRGGQYVANTSFAAMGAGSVTVGQAYQNQLVADQYLDRQWSREPLTARLFDVTDYRSAIARVINGAGINPRPSSFRDYFANLGKLVGAIPGYLSTGMFNNYDARASALAAVAYDTGAPTIEFTPDFLDKISGQDESYDYDVNAAKVYEMLSSSGGSAYRDYTQDCLGLTIGPGPDYKVTASEITDPNKALLVGLQGGSWKSKGCEAKGQQDDYQRVALYAGLDYQVMAGFAWYGAAADDPELQRIAQELGFTNLVPSGPAAPVIGGSSQQLAQALLSSGKVTFLNDATDPTTPQIQSYADNGTPFSGTFAGSTTIAPCHVDRAILTLATQMIQDHSIMISSLNRYCWNYQTASGTSSYHWTTGGGHAIDIAQVDGVSVTGRDQRSIDFLNAIMPLLPAGSGIGQSNCGGGLSLPAGITEFNDTCNHIHIQLPESSWDSG